MKDQIRFSHLQRGELTTRAPNALLLVPVGATEQHGPGLPTGTDTISTETVALAAASQASEQVDVVVAPVIPYGCSPHHLPHGATLSLESQTLLSMLCQIGASAATSGFRRIFYLNGHGGNHEIVQLAARDTALSNSIHAAGGSWWDIAREELLEAGASTFPRVPGHAGAFEGSVMSAIDADLVSLDNPAYSNPHHSYPKPPTPYRAELAGFWIGNDGYTDNPNESRVVDGQHLLEVSAEVITRNLIDFYRSTQEIEEQ